MKVCKTEQISWLNNWTKDEKKEEKKVNYEGKTFQECLDEEMEKLREDEIHLFMSKYDEAETKKSLDEFIMVLDEITIPFIVFMNSETRSKLSKEMEEIITKRADITVTEFITGPNIYIIPKSATNRRHLFRPKTLEYREPEINEENSTEVMTDVL